MSMVADIIKKQKVSIIVTAAVVLLVSVYYFAWGTPYPGMLFVYRDAAVYRDMKLKANYADGTLKVFALATPAALSAYRAAEGESVVRDNTVVIGWAEGRMMRREGLFSEPGDTIKNFFGIDPIVGGVLGRTFGLVDDMHFVSKSQFEKIDGEEGRVFIAVKDNKSPKLFFVLAAGETPPMTLPFAEGSLADYTYREINGRRYYPVILGSGEAAMMKFERLFRKPGDTIDGFFGRDIVITGVLAETDTIIDMGHISPLTAADTK